jgi:hypothetical protein
MTALSSEIVFDYLRYILYENKKVDDTKYKNEFVLIKVNKTLALRHDNTDSCCSHAAAVVLARHKNVTCKKKKKFSDSFVCNKKLDN